MKNTIALFVYTLAIATAVSCGGESKSSSSTAFKIQPGDVSKFDTTISGTSFNVTFDEPFIPEPPGKTGTYAIIFQKNINGTDYVGIAFGKDPKTNRKFKGFIYFNSSNLIGTFNDVNATISIIGDDGKKYIKKDINDTISLTISEDSGLYEINISKPVTSNKITLTDGSNDVDFEFSNDPDITAYLVQ